MYRIPVCTWAVFPRFVEDAVEKGATLSHRFFTQARRAVAA